jgi:hypothetical protein
MGGACGESEWGTILRTAISRTPLGDIRVMFYSNGRWYARLSAEYHRRRERLRC